MSSTGIYKPTWLYIKQHNQTGLKYFGKTTKPDPYRYKGSGKYWLAHLKKHGPDITTIWCQRFDTQTDLVKYAITFSKEHNIVESSDWANLMDENGMDGFPVGMIRTDDHRRKLSEAQRGHADYRDAETKALAAAKASKKLKGKKKPSGFGDKIRAIMLGKKLGDSVKERIHKSWTDDRRKEQGERRRVLNNQRPVIECPHCHKVGKLKMKHHLSVCPVLHPKENTRLASNNRATGWILLSPDGIRHKIISLRRFCKENALNAATMVEVSLGNRSHHKGWTVIERLTDVDIVSETETQDMSK